MERPQVPTLIGATRPGPRRVAARPGTYEPNFGLLASNAGWRTTWSAIVAGRFTASPFSGLLFVEESTAYAELYDTDGQGRIVAPYRRKYTPLGERTTWTHVVPGYFGPSGLTGLLLYDQGAGYGRFYNNKGQGDFVLRSDYSGWRTSWTHIVAGRFVASSPFSSVFLYSASENYGEIWATDGKGLVGTAPYQTFPNFSSFRFTHVLGGDFHWTPGYIDQVPALTDLFFYDAETGHGEMYRCGRSPDDTTAGPVAHSIVIVDSPATSASLPRRVTCVAAGNFGGLGNTDLAFYDGPGGRLSFYSFKDKNDLVADLVLRETQSGLRTTASLVVSGNFWMPNSEDHWFNDGPPVSSTPPFDPNWRFGTGGFSDLLLYDKSAGLGEFYFHEPLPPSVPVIDGYITSQSSHVGASPVSSGSVLPGESISFHVSSQSGPYSITIYRQAIFAGDQSEQRMGSIDGLPRNPVPFAIRRTAYKDGANWPAVASFVIPRTWPTGFYLARVQTSGAQPDSIDLPFVVRAPSRTKSPVLLVITDCTYCAYNDWGGRSTYGYTSGEDFTGSFPSVSTYRIPYGFQLAFDRPSHGGMGNLPQNWEIPFLLWLSRRGVPFDVCTSRDLHFEAPDPHEYRLLMFAGHHEYWSAQMRTNVETFVASGGNVAFFAGNVCWWQIRLSSDGRRLLCYKFAPFDPVSTTSDHALTTAHWFDDLVKRPETALTGVSWLGDQGIFNDADHLFTVTKADHWVFAGTGLVNGNTFGSYGGSGADKNSVVGPETDRVQKGGPNGLTSPPDYRLASVYVPGSDPPYEVGTMGIFRPPGLKSGETFNAPTINWAGGLNHDEHSWNLIDQITLNVSSKLGPPHPSPWTSVSEGRSTPGAPITAVVTGQNEVTLFLADPAGGVYTTSGNASGWRPWTSVSEGRSTPGAPITAVVTGPKKVTLFLADPGGGVYMTSGNAHDGWQPWSSVSEGQSTPGAPIAAVATGTNRVTLFLADPGGSVYTTSGNVRDGWQPWSSVSEGQSKPGAPITAVVTGPNRVTLFLADPGGGVYTTSGNATDGWEPWSSVSQGRSTPGAPITAVVTGQNEVTLLLADPKGGIYTTSGNAHDSWRPWTSVSEGQTKPGAPITAVVASQKRVTLFLADSVGGIYRTSGNANDGWQPWASVSEGRSTAGARLAAVVTSQNQIVLFLADPNGGVYTATATLLS